MTKVGRPTKITPDIINKIIEVAALDGSVEEMAMFAGIHPSTLYNRLKEDKEFQDRITALRNKPVLLARRTIIKDVGKNSHIALEYLKRKRRKEFGDNVAIDVTLPKPILENITKNNEKNS